MNKRKITNLNNLDIKPFDKYREPTKGFLILTFVRGHNSQIKKNI